MRFSFAASQLGQSSDSLPTNLARLHQAIAVTGSSSDLSSSPPAAASGLGGGGLIVDSSSSPSSPAASGGSTSPGSNGLIDDSSGYSPWNRLIDDSSGYSPGNGGGSNSGSLTSPAPASSGSLTSPAPASSGGSLIVPSPGCSNGLIAGSNGGSNGGSSSSSGGLTSPGLNNGFLIVGSPTGNSGGSSPGGGSTSPGSNGLIDDSSGYSPGNRLIDDSSSSSPGNSIGLTSGSLASPASSGSLTSPGSNGFLIVGSPTGNSGGSSPGGGSTSPGSKGLIDDSSGYSPGNRLIDDSSGYSPGNGGGSNSGSLTSPAPASSGSSLIVPSPGCSNGLIAGSIVGSNGGGSSPSGGLTSPGSNGLIDDSSGYSPGNRLIDDSSGYSPGNGGGLNGGSLNGSSLTSPAPASSGSSSVPSPGCSNGLVVSSIVGSNGGGSPSGGLTSGPNGFLIVGSPTGNSGGSSPGSGSTSPGSNGLTYARSTTPATPSFKSAPPFAPKETFFIEQQNQQNQGRRPFSNCCTGCVEKPCGACGYCKAGRDGSCMFRPCSSKQSESTICGRHAGALRMTISDPGLYQEKYDRVYLNGDEKICKVLNGRMAAKRKSNHNDELLSMDDCNARKKQRCNNCPGCNEGACQACYKCMHRGAVSCCFRPCANYSVGTLRDKHDRARNMAKKNPTLYQTKFDKVFGDQRIQIVLNGNGTCGLNKKKYNKDVCGPQHKQYTTRPPSSVLQKPKHPSIRKQRCNNCPGCNEEACRACACLEYGPGSCIFRPCHDLSEYTILDRHGRARRMREKSPNTFKAKYDRVYGDPRIQSMLDKKPSATRKGTHELDEKHKRNEDESEPKVLLEKRKRSLTKTAECESASEELSASGTQHTGPELLVTERRCGACASCQLEKECGTCISCQSRKIRKNTSKRCILTLCPHYGYTVSTLRDYWRFSQRSNCPPKEFEMLFNSMYGEEGWVTKEIERHDKNVAIQEMTPLSSSSGSRRCVTRACTLNDSQGEGNIQPMTRRRPAPGIEFGRQADQRLPSDQHVMSIKKKCGSCKSCQLATRCGACETCRLRESGYTSKSCILQLCENYGYALRTLQEYWRFAAKSSPPKESQALFDSMFGENGWVTLEVAANPSNAGQQNNVLGQIRKKIASSVKLCNDRTSCNSPTDLEIGSRCYAKYLNGQWYWSTVTSISGRGRTRLFTVRFDDDGDVLTELPSYCVSAKEELARDFGPNEHRQCPDLQNRCCNECTLCVKGDCGKCQSCKGNKRQISTLRDVCQLKICLSIPVGKKKHPLFGPLKGFSYFITVPDQLNRSLRRSPAAHPGLEGLVILDDKSGAMYRTLRDACRSLNMSLEALQEAETNLYYHTLGISLTKEIYHQLLGQGFYQEWQDCSGKRMEVFGTITRCGKNQLDDSLLFTVKIRNGDWRERLVPENIEITSEEDVWGGFMAYMKKSGQDVNLVAMRPPFYRTFILPSPMSSPRYNDEYWIPVLSYWINNYRFELEARESSIPNAGLGLWVTCHCTSLSSERVFELPEGTLVDLGVYAASRDCKGGHLSLLKNFIHSWTPELWSYDSTMPSAGSVYDITDDMTGNLQETARKNPIVYVNETDGNSLPTIYADRDPEGSIHFYLGHSQADQGPFRLPIGEPVELKIDYGPKYESVRVRKGYPRVTGEELKSMRNQIEQDDNDVIRVLHESTAIDIRESIDFLNSVFQNFLVRDGDQLSKVERALIATIVMKNRFEEIRNELENVTEDRRAVSNEGFLPVEQEELAKTISVLLSNLCSLFPCGQNQLKNCLVANDWYRMVLIQELRLKKAELECLSVNALRRRIESGN